MTLPISLYAFRRARTWRTKAALSGTGLRPHTPEAQHRTLARKHRERQLKDNIYQAKHLAHKHMETGVLRAKLGDPRTGLRRYLLLKYLQVLVIPQGSELVLILGTLWSLHTVLLLSSPRVSCKASNVLLGQLASVDALLLLRWAAGALGGVLQTLAQGLLGAHRYASLLLLSCLSLEALLVRWWPEETRRLRTVRCARLASAGIWAMTLGELLALQAAEHGPVLRQLLAGPVSRACLLVPLLLCTFSHCLRVALWLANTWVYYVLFYSSPQRRKSCFH